MDLLHFHDLPPAREGEFASTRPPELQAEWSRRTSLFQLGEPRPGPPLDLVGFIVTGPERVDRYALVVQAEDIPTRTELDAHRAAIKRTMPEGWHLVVRTVTV